MSTPDEKTLESARALQMTVPELLANREFLLKMARTKMPFGRYEGVLLMNLPMAYIVWFARNGYPEGQLGQMLELVHEIKLNELDSLIRPLLPRS